jgi:hypothetical protein
LRWEPLRFGSPGGLFSPGQAELKPHLRIAGVELQSR